MSITIRILLSVLAAAELCVGFWNQFFPQSFYNNVPTVDLTPPFSEHYARDFGGATLGLSIILTVAAIIPRTALVITAAAAYSAFSLPHFVFHLSHLAGATTAQAVALSVANGAALVAGLVVIALALRRRHVVLQAQRVRSRST